MLCPNSHCYVGPLESDYDVFNFFSIRIFSCSGPAIKISVNTVILHSTPTHPHVNGAVPLFSVDINWAGCCENFSTDTSVSHLVNPLTLAYSHFAQFLNRNSWFCYGLSELKSKSAYSLLQFSLLYLTLMTNTWIV